MGAVATFDPTGFVARYPEFATVSPTLLGDYFTEATLYHANDGTGPVCDAAQQALFLNMLTAHIASLYSGINGQAPSPIVGRISNASEGSVSVATQNDYPPGTVQWFQQTKYGSSYWAATMKYRTMNYRRGAPRAFGARPFGF